jgi:hypothetical protein
VGLVLGTSPLYAQGNLFTITVPSASIHAAPTTASPVIATAPRGRSFTITRELGSWVAIETPAATSGIGYLHVSWGTLSLGDAVEAGRTASTPLTPASSPDVRQVDPEPGELARQPGSRVHLPSHVVGVGGRMGIQALSGFAVMGRLWFAGPVGAQLELGRATHTSAGLPRMSVMDVGVSAITSFPDLANNALWIRPYVGGGISVFRASLRSTSGTAVATDTSPGYQAFGGAEFTSANLPQLAVSAEVRHIWATTPFGGFENGGLGLGLGAHWYVK